MTEPLTQPRSHASPHARRDVQPSRECRRFFFCESRTRVSLPLRARTTETDQTAPRGTGGRLGGRPDRTPPASLLSSTRPHYGVVGGGETDRTTPLWGTCSLGRWTA